MNQPTADCISLETIIHADDIVGDPWHTFESFVWGKNVASVLLRQESRSVF